ncbi:MAG: CHC2 zinc finger domain-containing protein [Clostridia bacterium]|nr:CHC2 zinc finger domain-containing protein [Clostridia bacterium]
MRIDAVKTIKDRLKMREVLERYGYTADRKGFICCPFHNEKTPSMRIYEKDYHCFGCQEHGDIITFIQKLFGLSFQDTLRKIDADFGLNIYGDHSFEELRRSHYQQQALQAKREREKREREKVENEYWAAFDEWKRLDDNRRLYRPKSPDEELHPLFVESLQWLEHQKRVLYDMEDRRRYYE